ncbi:hypothetical protein Rhopal_005727-T1 [Rhodotorula paludigena]|uniref:Homeodomain transcription factor HD2 n=1 Tax=Rhodotorula paludigena TaxID=86838 RepID=A0AAV5GUH3_9BASI|nr:hypothetical protein Rhopal_005727-T1 [Rhodotorula paludigena]
MSSDAPPAVALPPAETALLASTTTHERVLVAQAVFERGTGDYAGVGKLLEGHALLRERGPEWFTADNLGRVFGVLLANAGYDPTTSFPAQAPELRKVAHKYYMDRVHELYEAMQLCQDQFRITYSEIQELKDGKLDWKLTHPDRALPPSPVRPGTALPAADAL